MVQAPALVIPGDDASVERADYSQAGIAQSDIKSRERSAIGLKKLKSCYISRITDKRNIIRWAQLYALGLNGKLRRVLN